MSQKGLSQMSFKYSVSQMSQKEKTGFVSNVSKRFVSRTCLFMLSFHKRHLRHVSPNISLAHSEQSQLRFRASLGVSG